MQRQHPLAQLTPDDKPHPALSDASPHDAGTNAAHDADSAAYAAAAHAGRDVDADSTPEDEELLTRVARGDEAAFRTLYRRHTPRIHALAKRMLSAHQSDTDDVLQESWIRAITRLPTFKRNSAFATWLGGITVHVALELIRRRSRETDDPGVDLAAAPQDGLDRIDIETALARLPNAHRVTVVLHDVEGYSHSEIAKLLDIAEGTSRSNLFRARQALRSMLESPSRIPK